VNHTLPSAPAAIPNGPLFAVGIVNSVIVPVGVIRPILSPLVSVNHTLASAPAAIPNGELPAVGIVNPVGEPAVFDGTNFIASPGGLFPAQNPAVVAVGHLDPLRCVVVLGEPGIGKSTLLKAEYERAREAHARTLWVDLGAFDDSRQLSEHIFEDAVWSTTSSDDDEVVLFLDGLDEAWLRLPTVSDLLVRAP
jgi:hypothetical protein